MTTEPNFPVPQKDQLSERDLAVTQDKPDRRTRKQITRVQPQYLPQSTLQYRTFLKRAIVEGLINSFELYLDPTLEKCKIGIDYQTSHINFPNIVVKYKERSLKNMGVAHTEWMNTSNLIELVIPEAEVDAETGIVKNIAETGVLKAAETLVSGPGVYTGTFVREIIDPHSILLSLKPKNTGVQELRFKGISSDKYIPFHHYIYNGDISLEVYGMSSADRDRVSDAIVEIIGMGTVGAEGLTFQERLYATVGATNQPFSEWHFIAVNTDLLKNGGEGEELAPWMPEDVWLYKTEYSFQIMGEFYSLVPETKATELGLVEQVDIHPYHQQWFPSEPTDIIPVGENGDAYHLEPPYDYPDGEVPQADYIPITKRSSGRGVSFTQFQKMTNAAILQTSLAPRLIE